MYIYKAFPRDNPSEVYVGRTKDILQRQREHHWARNRSTCSLSKYIRDNPGKEIVFEILEECEDNISAEREDFWCRQIGTINIIKCINRTIEDIKKYNRDYARMKRLENSEVIDCVCGKKYVSYNKHNHVKTKYHLLNCN